LAQLLDEVRLAGRKAVSLDSLFSEPQESAAQLKPGEGDDELLAAALGRFEKRMLATSVALPAGDKQDRLAIACEEVLVEHLEYTAEQLSELQIKLPDGRAATLEDVTRVFLSSRRAAMLRRIGQELAKGDGGLDELMPRVLPGLDPSINSPLTRLFKDQYRRASALARASERGVTAPPDLPLPFSVQFNIEPIPTLTAQTTGLGFVDYEFFFRK